jgi:glycosyltransferase involved in cell wall biosynthesis
VGYIYDFQHRHLPQFFTEAERAGRDATFARMLGSASVVICNSEAVRDDAERFHPGSARKIVALPFAPIPREQWFDLDPAAARRRHALPQRYFIVCNQFWIHKDHPTAIRAFAEFRARGGDPEAALVCTGTVQDYRDSSYPETIRALIRELGLEGRAHLLGHIPKDDQIALLRGAIAVLQPTWFEGGRGGGAVTDALSMGVPALVSDIAVNREIVHAGCRFFPKGDPAALAALMLEVAAAEPVRPDRAELLKRAGEGVARLSSALAGAIQVARDRAQ